jgi:hypothetical protein
MLPIIFQSLQQLRIPRPFGRGELAGFRDSGWNLVVAIFESRCPAICRTPMTRHEACPEVSTINI